MSTAARTTPSTATASGRTRLTLTRRGRTVFITLASIPLVALAFALSSVAFNGNVATATDIGTTGSSFEYVTVTSGQSLWELAETMAPRQDPRDVIGEIVSLNQLVTEAVQPGQRLAIPAGYTLDE